MEMRIVKTARQHRLYLAEISRLMEKDPTPQSAAGARLELLAKLVEDYEKIHFPVAKPDPVDAIRFRMEQQGLRQKDLAEMLGGKNRASEVLSGKRALTVQMIRALNRHLHIPTELLVP
ncbi:MAG: helix-turn-helix domain-containing protein [Steroidobacteraceae bacterium]